ncbi:MAG TPA: DUF5654 family protein [Candidatus Bipolaricaulota bacterium]|nr:DUF5654 family protein [Candidatus Bipolaricaulota bacterium]
MQKEKENEKKSIKLEVLEKLSALIIAGFGLVAALAWNDAIKALFNKFFPAPSGNLVAGLIYAVAITAIVVIVTIQFGRMIRRAKNVVDKLDK